MVDYWLTFFHFNDEEEYLNQWLNVLQGIQVEDIDRMMLHFGIGFTLNNEEPRTRTCEGEPGESNKQCNCFYENDCKDVLYYYHSDHIGSSTFLTDAAGIPYEFMLYLPFGEAMAHQKVAGWATPYTFTGKEQDAATGLHYFSLSRPKDERARYLDTRLSIWFGVDPLAESPANIGYSSYHYVWNNPLRFIDPTGMQGVSTHLDEDSNVIASFDDGDNNVYMHCNGTTASDIQAHNYYQSGRSGTNVTNGGGTQIAGVEVSIVDTKIDKSIVNQEGVTGTLIIGLGVTFSMGLVSDNKGNTKRYYEFGVGVGFDASLGYEWLSHKNLNLANISVYDIEGASLMRNIGVSYFDTSWGGNQGNFPMFDQPYGDKFKSLGFGVSYGIPVAYTRTGSYTWVKK